MRSVARELSSDAGAIYAKLNRDELRGASREEMLHQVLKIAVEQQAFSIITEIVNKNSAYWYKPLYKGNTLFHYLAKSDLAIDALNISKKEFNKIIDRTALQENEKGETPFSIAIAAGKNSEKLRKKLSNYLEPQVRKVTADIRAGQIKPVIKFIRAHRKEEIDALLFGSEGLNLLEFSLGREGVGLLEFAKTHLTKEKFQCVADVYDEKTLPVLDQLQMEMKAERESNVIRICELIKDLYRGNEEKIFNQIKEFIRNRSEEELDAISVTARGANIFQFAALYLPLNYFIKVFETPSLGQQQANVLHRITRTDKRGNTLFKYAASNDMLLGIDLMLGTNFSRACNQIPAYLHRQLQAAGSTFVPSSNDLTPIPHVDSRRLWLGKVNCSIQVNYENQHADLAGIFSEFNPQEMENVGKAQLLHKLLKRAVKHEATTIIRTIIATLPETYLSEPFYKGNTLFHYLAKSDKAMDVVLLQQKKLNQIKKTIALQKNNKGETPLGMAVAAGKKAEKTRKTLLKYVEPQIVEIKANIKLGRVDLVIDFIKTYGSEVVDTLSFSREGASLYQYAALHLDYHGLERLLKADFANKSQRNPEKSYGVDLGQICKLDMPGRTLLDYALMKKNLTNTELLTHLRWRAVAVNNGRIELNAHRTYMASILFHLKYTSVDDFAFKAQALIELGADLTVRCERTQKTLAQYVMEVTHDTSLMTLMAMHLASSKQTDCPLANIFHQKDTNGVIAVLNKIKNPAELSCAVALLIQKSPPLVAKIAERIDECEALLDNVDALMKLAQFKEMDSPQGALYLYLLALEAAESQNDKKQQDAIKHEIYRIKQSAEAKNAKELLKMANLRIAVLLKNELASMSVFNLPGRMRIFNKIAQLAKQDANINLLLADCYYEGLVPGMQFNQRATAIAMYRAAHRQQSYYAEWKLIQIRLMKEQDEELVSEALLSSLRLLGSREPNKVKALEFIERCGRNSALSLELRYFAQMIDGVVNGNAAVSKAAYARLQVKDPNGAKHMLNQIEFTIQSSEDKQLEEIDEVVYEVREELEFDYENSAPSAPFMSQEVLVQENDFVPQPPFYPYVHPQEPDLPPAFSFDYLDLPNREKTEEVDEEPLTEAVISSKPVQEEVQQNNLRILSLFRRLIPKTPVPEETEMEELNPQIEEEAARVEKTVSLIESAPSVPNTTLLSSVMAFFTPKKSAPIQKDKAAEKRPQLAQG